MKLPFGRSEGSLRNFHIAVRDTKAEVSDELGFLVHLEGTSSALRSSLRL